MAILSKLGLTGSEEDDRVMRAILYQATGKKSRAELTEREQLTFIAALEKMQAKDRKQRRPHQIRSERSRQIVMASNKQKITVTHIFFDTLAWTSVRVEPFIARVTQGRARSVDTLTSSDAQTVIEVLKSIQRREIKKLIEYRCVDEIDFCSFYGCAGVDGIDKSHFHDAIKRLRAM